MKRFLIFIILVFFVHLFRTITQSETEADIHHIQVSTDQQKALQDRLQSTIENLSFENKIRSQKLLVKVDKIEDPFAITVDYNGEMKNIRLIGCRIPIGNLPNVTDEFYAKEANDYLAKLIGSYIWIETDNVMTDKYGSYWVYATKDGVSINADMLEKGLATFDTIEQGNHKMESTLSEKSKFAAINQIGIWSGNDTPSNQ